MAFLIVLRKRPVTTAVSILLLLYLAFNFIADKNVDKEDHPLPQAEHTSPWQMMLDTTNTNIELAPLQRMPVDPSHVVKTVSQRMMFMSLYQSYQLPTDDLAAQFNRYAQSLDTDISGSTHLKIARILYACVQVPNTVEALQAAEDTLVTHSLALGSNNKTILQRLAHLRNRYTDCQHINHAISIKKYYAFMEQAAKFNNAIAKVELATWMVPPGFKDWKEQEKIQHRKKMGEYLHAARAQCELRAFQAYAYPEGYGEGDQWTYMPTKDFSLAMIAYANFVASKEYIQNHIPNAVSLLQHQQILLQNKSMALSINELQQAEHYGQQLYKQNCQGKKESRSLTP